MMLKSTFMNTIIVLYVPCLHSNFLSITKFIEFGHIASIPANSGNIVSKKDKIMFFAVKENGILFAKLKIGATAEYVYGAEAENNFIK